MPDPDPLFLHIAYAAGGLVVALLVIRLLRRITRRRGPAPASLPPASYFYCAHCAKQFPHAPRTVQAWQRGSRRFFCQACHAARLKEQDEERRASDLH